MKPVFVLIVLMCFSNNSFSQEDKDYNAIALEFKQLYNKKEYASIYKMYSESRKKIRTLSQTMGFFKNNIEPNGTIQHITLLKIEEGKYHYRTKFEKRLAETRLVIDKYSKISSLKIIPYKPENLPRLERNITKMILPFKEVWFVGWGGTTIEQNYHFAYNNQKYAYDLLIVKDGKSHKGNPKNNANYYAFGKSIIAPCDAKVIKVITGVHDNIPGEKNPKQVSGNTVVLETIHKEYITFSHLKKNSIIVKEEQQVKQGELLGQCGNSGNSSEPHLHLSLQNTVDMTLATGAKLYFNTILVNGKIEEDYIPIKNDKIQNIKL